MRARSVEDWGHNGDIRQMGTAVVRVVDRIHLTRPHCADPAADDFPDGGAHRAEMYRNVRCIGNQVAVRIEQRTREVQPLTDIHRLGSRLQPEAHLLGDRHEQVVEDLQEHGIGLGARIGLHGGYHPLGEQMSGLGQLRLPAIVDDGGGVGLDDDRRAGHSLPWPHPLPVPQWSFAPQSTRVDPDGFRRAGVVGDLITQVGQIGLLGEPGRLHRDRAGDQRTVHQE